MSLKAKHWPAVERTATAKFVNIYDALFIFVLSFLTSSFISGILNNVYVFQSMLLQIVDLYYFHV